MARILLDIGGIIIYLSLKIIFMDISYSTKVIIMSVNHVKQLVILAAGQGSRIRTNGQELPKPLVDVGGLPLLKRSILTAKKAGVERFVVILGYEALLEVFCKFMNQISFINIGLRAGVACSYYSLSKVLFLLVS